MAPGAGDTAIEDRLFVAGTSHRTAPVAFREKLAPRPDQIPAILRDLVSGRVDEAVLVTTCNRFEIYGVARESADVTLVAPALATHFGVDVDANRSAFYMHLGAAAALHAFRVAASLDSLVVGESQVLGQVKNAHRRATEAGTCGKVLNRLFNKAIAAGKRARTETKIGANAVSVSYAAVELAKKLFGRLDGRRVLVVGVGEMSTLVAQHLKSNGATDLTITNRTLQGAVNMADEVGGKVIEFERFEEALAGVDIVLTATGSTRPILTAEQVGRVLASRRQKPLFLIDIAVPRDVEESVGDLANAYLFNIDDLQAVADQNYRGRIKEARKAEALVEEESAAFARWLRSLRAVPIIEKIQALSSEIVGAEREKLVSRLERLEEKEREAVLQALGGVVAKVLHRPMVNIKRLAQDEDADLWLSAAEELFFGEIAEVEHGTPAPRPEEDRP